MHKRIKLQKKYGIPCAKKSRFCCLWRIVFLSDNQEDGKQFHGLKYFPEKKLNPGLENMLCPRLAKKAGMVRFFRGRRRLHCGSALSFA